MYETNYQNPAQVPYVNPLQPNVEPMKKFFSSPLFLALGILGLVNCVLTLFTSSFTIDPATLAELQNSLSSLGVESVPQVNFNFNLNLTGIAMSIAFILFYAFAKKPGNSIKAPAMILKVVSIISFVLVCIVIGLLIILLALVFAIGSAVSSYSGYGDADSVAGVIGILAIVFIPVFAFLFFSSFATFRFYSGIHKTITTPALKRSFATFIGVMQIISLVVMTPSLLLASISMTSPFLLLSSATSIAYSVLHTIFIFKYRSFIKEEEAKRAFPPVNQPPYGQAPVNNPYGDPAYNPYTAPQEIPQPVNEAPVVEASAPVENPQPVCKQCGNAVNENDSFCMNCGSPIER